jgi:hypothetical protein
LTLSLPTEIASISWLIEKRLSGNIQKAR